MSFLFKKNIKISTETQLVKRNHEFQVLTSQAKNRLNFGSDGISSKYGFLVGFLTLTCFINKSFQDK